MAQVLPSLIKIAILKVNFNFGGYFLTFRLLLKKQKILREATNPQKLKERGEKGRKSKGRLGGSRWKIPLGFSSIFSSPVPAKLCALSLTMETLRIFSGDFNINQDDEKGGLSLREVAVTTETATTAATAKTVKTVTAASWYCIL